VPNQRPEDILKKLRAHLDAKGFADIEIEYHGGGAPGRTDPADPLVKLAVETAREVYGRDVVVEPMTGGSGPNALFIDALHIPIIMVGVGNPGDRLHAPDENVNLEDFVKGTQHTARVVANFPKL
jgi:acetylornithine deacetylase/succinyl-diaminopimelate desuccinylase-like protein